jgi:enamine deaminase RidA (YjgF/YER057c/UK114 family)
MSQITRVAAANGGSYSDAVIVEAPGVRWIHIAGQTPRPPVRGDLAEQSQTCLEQIRAILGDLGAGLEHLVQMTVYLTDLTVYASFAEVRRQMIGAHAPTSAAVGVASLLDGALVEIAAVAAVPVSASTGA